MEPTSLPLDMLNTPTAPHALTRKLAGQGMSLAKINQVASEFEAMFLGQMLKPMFETVETDSLFGGGQGEGPYRDMMVQEYAKEISKRGGIGIADAVRKQMLQMQEVS